MPRFEASRSVVLVPMRLPSTPVQGYDERMKDPSAEDPRFRYRHLEPPIALDQTMETVDASTAPELQDEAYREQEWLIRTVPN